MMISKFQIHDPKDSFKNNEENLIESPNEKRAVHRKNAKMWRLR